MPEGGALMALHPTLLRLVQALAEDAAREDYLAAQASNDAGQAGERQNPAPLPATDKAA